METKPILIDDGDIWKVLSSNRKDYYTVCLRGNGKLECECLGFQYRGTCRHVRLVQPLIEEGKLRIIGLLTRMESNKIPLAEIDNYLSDQEFDRAIANGLIVVNDGKVVVL